MADPHVQKGDPRLGSSGGRSPCPREGSGWMFPHTQDNLRGAAPGGRSPPSVGIRVGHRGGRPHAWGGSGMRGGGWGTPAGGSRLRQRRRRAFNGRGGRQTRRTCGAAPSRPSPSLPARQRRAGTGSAAAPFAPHGPARLGPSRFTVSPARAAPGPVRGAGSGACPRPAR